MKPLPLRENIDQAVLDTAWHEAGHAVLIAYFGQVPGQMAATQEASVAAGVAYARGFVDTTSVYLAPNEYAVVALAGCHARNLRHGQISTLYDQELDAAIRAIRAGSFVSGHDLSGALCALIQHLGRPFSDQEAEADRRQAFARHGDHADLGVIASELVSIECVRGFECSDADLAAAYRAADAEAMRLLAIHSNRGAVKALAEKLAEYGSLEAAEVTSILSRFLPVAKPTKELS